MAPLNPRLTARELSACLDVTSSAVLLAEPDTLEAAQAVAGLRDIRVLLVPELGPSEDLPDLSLPGDATVLVLHTSGTSGLPKPVVVRQDRLAARAKMVAGLLDLGPGDVYATASPFHHIAGVGMLTVALGLGAAVALMPAFTVEAYRALAGHGTTHVLVVPTMMDRLLASAALGLPSLRVLQYGASPVNPETLRKVLAVQPGLDLVQTYGQTEGSPLACLTAADHRLAATGCSELLGSAGRAPMGVELKVEGQDADDVGEICARADHLFSAAPDGWLRTGDLGRITDGYVYLFGRKHDRIVRAGENVEPLEVEQVLEEHPSVSEAAVIGVPDRELTQAVKAWLVPAQLAGEIDLDEVTRFARARLAGYKVPTQWAVVPVLPRSPEGKLLRRELRS